MSLRATAAFGGRTKSPGAVVLFAILTIALSLATILLFPGIEELLSRPARKARTEEQVTLLIVTDPPFAERYRTQIQSVKCYAEQQKYGFHSLNPTIDAPLCDRNHKTMYYKKHCTVATWLQAQPDTTTGVVLDADIVAGFTNVSLDAWLEHAYDISFYERSWNFEVACGNYIVRNTPFSRLFLRAWAMSEGLQPPGFASTDQGSLHIILLRALGIRGREKCVDIYRNLTAPVEDLGPFFEFVACVKRLLGPPRVHVVPAPLHMLRDDEGVKQDIAGRIVIFPRFFGIALDAHLFGLQTMRSLQPFHHGLKQEDWKTVYGNESASNKTAECTTFTTGNGMTADEAGPKLRQSDTYVTNTVAGDPAAVPRWLPVDDSCYDKLWCAPLASPVAEWPKGVVSRDGKLVDIEYEDPGVDWHNTFVHGLYERAVL